MRRAIKSLLMPGGTIPPRGVVFDVDRGQVLRLQDMLTRRQIRATLRTKRSG